MKILQIVPDLQLAGAQTMCEHLTIELSKNPNNFVEIICLYNQKTEITERLEKNNIKIHYLSKEKGYDFKLIYKLYKIINDFGPDVIHSHRYSLEYLMPALLFYKKGKIKVVHTLHNIATKEVPKLLQVFQKYWFKKKKVIPVAISEIVRESAISRYNLKDEEISIVYNGIDLERCKKKESYSFNNRILHVGRFNEQKNHLRLIDIFAKCLKVNKEIKLYLVGAGELQDKVIEKVKQLKIEKNVLFCGTVNESFSIMNESDIFVLSSDWEGMPMTLIEAMGTGLPCICFPVGGIPDMINNEENGFLVNSNEDFAKKIEMLINDKKLREKIGENAIKKSYMFSSKKMADNYQRIYRG